VEILDVETEDRNGLVHVALKGELDLSTVGKVQDELRRVEEGEPPVMVLDLFDAREEGPRRRVIETGYIVLSLLFYTVVYFAGR